jgi:predicted nucleotidyltransferase
LSLFGSVLKGTDRSDSDVDLLVIGEIGLQDVVGLLGGAAEKVGREINPKILTPSEFRRRKRTDDPFLSRVLAEPRLFITGDEHELGGLD